MSTITPNPVNLSQTWGAEFHDYSIDGNAVDFQDLMVAVSEKRATAVEGEVAPLTTRIQNRNKELDTLGSILASFTKLESTFGNEDSGDTCHDMGDFPSEWWPLASQAYAKVTGHEPHYGDTAPKDWWEGGWAKSTVEGMVSALKNMIDGRNNEAQSDMSRLQSLVDRRDESYSTATNLMSAISDSRANLIRNF